MNREAWSNAAGSDAQATGAKSASTTAAGEREESWGKAIGDGVQQGIEKGLTSAAGSLGAREADKVANQALSPEEWLWGAPAVGWRKRRWCHQGRQYDGQVIQREEDRERRQRASSCQHGIVFSETNGSSGCAFLYLHE